jgi:hypothetical protein
MLPKKTQMLVFIIITIFVPFIFVTSAPASQAGTIEKSWEVIPWNQRTSIIGEKETPKRNKYIVKRIIAMKSLINLGPENKLGRREF